jgi:hypothetical protein
MSAYWAYENWRAHGHGRRYTEQIVDLAIMELAFMVAGNRTVSS